MVIENNDQPLSILAERIFEAVRARLEGPGSGDPARAAGRLALADAVVGQPRGPRSSRRWTRWLELREPNLALYLLTGVPGLAAHQRRLRNVTTAPALVARTLRGWRTTRASSCASCSPRSRRRTCSPRWGRTPRRARWRSARCSSTPRRSRRCSASSATTPAKRGRSVSARSGAGRAGVRAPRARRGDQRTRLGRSVRAGTAEEGLGAATAKSLCDVEGATARTGCAPSCSRRTGSRC